MNNKMQVEEVKITYTARAWGQDSGLAMKGDVLRAIVELVTNCDDAYVRGKKDGPIHIEVRRFPKSGAPTEISVRDAATGLSPDDMKVKFAKMGGDESGFESGQDVRGLFSRGSNDTAEFGETVFEAIKDGVYSTLTLRITESMTTKLAHVDADESLYKSLCLAPGENGLSATMRVLKPGVKVPDLRTLVHRISTHIQLRRIVATREVSITEYRDGKLVQVVPVIWEEPASTVVFDDDIVITEYGVKARLQISQLTERSEGPVNEYTMHGVEVRGSRAAYMNDMFGQTSGACALIKGVVTCPAIDDLIRAYVSTGGDEGNPSCLVSRTRDGLEKDHPFTRALSVAVLEKLKPILEALEPKAEDGGSPELRKDLDTFAQLLAEELKGDLDEDDDDGVGGHLPTPSNPIVVIPPKLRAKIGSTRTLSILVHEGSAAADGLVVSISKGVCALIGTPTDLEHHPTFAETLVGQVRLSMVSLGSTNVVVSAESDPKESGACEVVVHDDDDDEKEPTTLEWKNTSMSVTVGKTRSVRLRAPLSLGPTGELEASIELDGANIQLEDSSVTLTLTSKGWLEAKVRVTGLSNSSESCTITATASGEIAEGTVRTTQPNPIGGLNIETKMENEYVGLVRGKMVPTDTGLLLTMYAKHKWLAPRIGVLKDDGTYSRDRELDARVAIIETMASVAADYSLAKKVKRDPGMYSDVDAIIFERQKIVDRYLRIMLQGLNG